MIVFVIRVKLFRRQAQQVDSVKSAVGFKNAVAPKPFGAPFDPFKPQPFQPFQPAVTPFRSNYQLPFGPLPGYPAYHNQDYQGAYPPPAFHGFSDPGHKPFGFQPFPAPAAQPAFGGFKFGTTPKKFYKNLPGHADFQLPGKYFQEHQFGAYHGPEFSSAIVPAEHNIKQSKPKDSLIGKPAVPNFPEFGLPKQAAFGGFAPPQPFGFPAVPAFPFQVRTT